MKVKLLIDFCGHKEGSIVDVVGPDVDGDCYLMSASGLIVSPNSDQIEVIQPTESEESAVVAIERDRIIKGIEELKAHYVGVGMPWSEFVVKVLVSALKIVRSE